MVRGLSAAAAPGSALDAMSLDTLLELLEDLESGDDGSSTDGMDVLCVVGEINVSKMSSSDTMSN